MHALWVARFRSQGSTSLPFQPAAACTAAGRQRTEAATAPFFCTPQWCSPTIGMPSRVCLCKMTTMLPTPCELGLSSGQTLVRQGRSNRCCHEGLIACKSNATWQKQVQQMIAGERIHYGAAQATRHAWIEVGLV